MRSIERQLGAAMVTVLFVGAALTAVSSAGAYLAIREFGAMDADRKAAEALALAESGVDRFLLEIRRGTLNWNRLKRAGCEDTDPATAPWLQQAGSIGSATRTYSATISVIDCAARPPRPMKTVPLKLRITSTGQHPAARRVIIQDLHVTPLGLPIGVYADSVDANGNAGMTSISLISRGDFVGREKISFVGTDPFYTKDDFYLNGDSALIPAAAHVTGRITFIQGGGAPEHPPSPHCGANGTSGTAGQSLWDGDKWTSDPAAAVITGGCAGTPHASSWPPTSLFTENDLQRVVPRPSLDEDDYRTLAEVAKQSGLYCKQTTVMACTKLGAPWTMPNTNITDADLNGLPKQFVFYVDYTTGLAKDNVIKWKGTQWDTCSDDPNEHESVIIIVRNGGMSFQSGAVLTGAIIAPDGEVDSQGGFTLHGTVIAKKFWYRGGATITLSPCWVNNMPGPFLSGSLAGWSEVDR